MNIIVCVKAVPDPNQSGKITIDPATKTLTRGDVPLVLNPLDKNALEAALLLKANQDAHISVVSYNGYVLIAGQVNTEQLKARATEVVRKVHGVRRIYNELEVAAPSSAMTRTSDTWITTKVKSWLLGSTDSEGTRVKVVTENGVVYLMGLATRAEAQRASDKAAGISGVQRVVRLFELVD